jgi:glycosyltransferase involved in cell wall biosynthesis
VLVSVIIPVYNGEKYLRQCIDSVLRQTNMRDYEIIVINDGSTDGTKDILESYYGKIEWISREINLGISASLNEGINFSSGKWIKWISADDEMLPNCLETLVRNATDYNTIYYTNYHIIDRHGSHITYFEEPGHPKDILWNKFFGNGSSSFIHRDVFERCGLFDESLRFGEDYEFWLRCVMLYNVNLTLIPKFTINYRNHPEQLTHKVGGGNDAIIKERIKGQIITS